MAVAVVCLIASELRVGGGTAFPYRSRWAARARLCLYAKGLIEPSERLILFVLCHSMQPSILFPSSSRLTPSQSLPQGISFFGRLKVEFFCGRDWQGVAMDEFVGKLDGCMV